MSKIIPKATHAGNLKIGDMVLPCAVLEDGTRLLTQEGFLKAIGRSGKPAKGRGSGVEKLAPFLDLNNLKPYVDSELESSTYPIVFQPASGSRAYGYKAELLPKVCEVYLKARDDETLLQSQLKFAAACDILMRGLAHVGIIALVDEATGYQIDRARDALEKILEAFISDELRKWVKTFPDEYYEEIIRLKKWGFPNSVKRPGVLGKYTIDIVYKRLAPGILTELEIKNPKIQGYRRSKHHSWLTADIGHPRLREHLSAVIALMKSSTTWDQFMRSLNRALPKYGENIQEELDLK